MLQASQVVAFTTFIYPADPEARMWAMIATPVSYAGAWPQLDRVMPWWHWRNGYCAEVNAASLHNWH